MTATALDATSQPSQTARSRSWVHMPGLDGVRAIAVTAVLLFHANPDWLPGGFLGVDVFFTLSGFLITSLLLAELGESGGIRFGRFYQRRARRLLPALFLVLIATSLLAVTVAQDAAQRVREDATAAFFYVTNWWYVVHDQSYFEATGRPPLLQHLWSLAVEEQFYFLWPVLLYALWRIGGVRGVRIGAIAGAVVSTTVMAFIAVRQGMPDPVDASRVYFGTDTHAMTLLVGAALATVWTPARIGATLTERGRAVANSLGVLALVALVAVLWFVGPTSTFLYRGGFLVIGLVTAGVIAAAAVTGTACAGALGRQPLRYLGERSYGIYLWHWPIFMVLRPGIDLDAEGWSVQVLRFAVTFAAAELSYRFVEMPIRRGALGRAWASWRERGTYVTVTRILLASVTATAVVVALGVGLGSAHEPTVADDLGGIVAVGDEPLVAPTLSQPGQSAASTAPTNSTGATGATGATAGPSSGPSPTPSGSTSSAPTPPAPHVPAVVAVGVDAFGLSTTAVGDSVMLAARNSIKDTFPGATLDAHVSRQPAEIFDRIRARKALGQLGDVVVIGAGTNGAIKTSDLLALLSQLSDRSRIVLVSVHADRPWVAQSNRAIATAIARFGSANVRLADWNTYSQGHRDWFYSDGIHTKGAGSAAYAQLIRDTLRS